MKKADKNNRLLLQIIVIHHRFILLQTLKFIQLDHSVILFNN